MDTNATKPANHSAEPPPGQPGQPANGWRQGLRFDLVAGMITAAVVMPKAMAYAAIAGLPVQVGLYTVLVPMLVYALFGTSRPLSVSTTTTLAILVAAQLHLVVPDGHPAALMTACATLTLLVGAMLILAGLFRLGFVANFISEPVLVGFKAGIGLVIVLDQIPKLLGVHFVKDGFFHNLGALLQVMPETSLPTLAVGAVMLILLVGLERVLPTAPAPLIAAAAGILGMRLFGLADLGVAAVGHLPRGLPGLVLPDLALVEHLWPGALGIALMSFTETIAAGRAFTASGEPPVRPNRELLATGLANTCGAFFGTMTAGGGTSQTAVNRRAGARSRLAGAITALATLLTLLVLAPLIGQMPQATLAAVVIVYSIDLIQPAEFRAILAVRRMEFFWALAAMAGVVLLGTLQGILVAIVVSLAALARQVTDPPVHVLARKPETNVFRPATPEHPEDETCPGLLILRLEGRIFFANAERLAEKIRPLVAQANPRVVIFDLSSVFDLEFSALKMLIEAERRQRERGVELWLVALTPEVLAVVRRSSLADTLGPERMFFSLEEAVRRYQRSFA